MTPRLDRSPCRIHDAMIVLAVMLYGHTGILSAAPARAEKGKSVLITCKPRFEVHERQDRHVMDDQGNYRTSYTRWLILDDGERAYRIAWGSPPLLAAPVTLMEHRVYTFTIRARRSDGEKIPLVLKIQNGATLVYERNSLQTDPIISP